MDYALVIIGAGHAGSTLAASLPPGMKVLLADRRSFTDPAKLYENEKCCGGMLDKRAQKALAARGIALPGDVLVSPQVFTLRGIDLDNGGRERYYQKQYVNIDRARFDRFLVRRALRNPSVELAEEAHAFGFRETEEGVTLSLRTPDGTRTVSCRYLVGADGACSWVRRKIDPSFSARSFKRYASLQEWYETAEEPACYTALFDRRVTDYYSWIIPENGRLIIGSALPADKSARARFERYKDDLRELGFDLSKPVKRRGAVILRPAPLGDICPGKGHFYLCGEAAGLISPSSCEGISFALESGRLLAESLSRGETPARYGRRLAPLKRKVFLNSLKSPVMYGPFLRGLVFRLGALSMKVDTNGANPESKSKKA